MTTDRRHARTTCFAAAAFALGQAIQVNNGVLHPAALAWISVALILLVLSFRERPIRLLTGVPVSALIGVFLAIQWIELTVWGVRWVHGAVAWYAGGMIVAGIGVGIAMRWPRRGLTLLVLGHLIAGAYVITATPSPRIDVWHFQQDSSAAMMRGENPYTVRFRNLYPSDTDFYARDMVKDGWLTCSCPYPPLPLMLVAPARAILGDVRWAHLLALEAAAVLIVLTAGSRAIAAAGMLLLTPRALLVIEAAWIDPIVILMLACTLYCSVRRPRMLWLALGLLLASKQYMVLIVPLLHLLAPTPALPRGTGGGGKAPWKLLLRAVGVAVAINLPFFLWNPPAFVQNIVMLQFRLPFRMDALSFTALFAHLSGMQIGAWAGFAAAGAMLLWLSRRAPRNPAGFAGAAALVLLVFFALNKQAFCNYYFLVIACCSCAMALSEEKHMSTEVDMPVTSRASTACPSPSPGGVGASGAFSPPTL